MTFICPSPASAHPILVCLDLQEDQPPVDWTDRDGRRNCIETCRDVLTRARRRNWRVAHLHRYAPKAGRISRGARPIQGLEPRPTEPIFKRAGPSAFSSAAFREHLAGLGHPPLAVIGFSLEGSALFTAVAAQEAGVPLTLVQGAVHAPAMGLLGSDVVETVLLGALGAFTEVLDIDVLFEQSADHLAVQAANLP